MRVTSLTAGELGREVIIPVRRVAHSMQEQHRLSLPAPIQIVEPDTVDGEESAFVGRLVCPTGSSIDLKREHQWRPQPPKFCLQRLHYASNSWMRLPPTWLSCLKRPSWK